MVHESQKAGRRLAPELVDRLKKDSGGLTDAASPCLEWPAPRRKPRFAGTRSAAGNPGRKFAEKCARGLPGNRQTHPYSQSAREKDKKPNARNRPKAQDVADHAAEEWSRKPQEDPHHESERP